MAISSAGLGSNLDVASIVSQLMSIEQQPLTLLVKKEASFQAKLSGFGTLKGALSQFQTGVRALSDITKFQGVRVSAGDSTIVSATGTAGSAPGTYSMEISKLAQAQKLVAAGQTSSSMPIGNGTVTFDFGTISGATVNASGKYTGATFTTAGTGVKTVTIDSSNNSLTGIRDAINSAKIGVTAAIVNDGGTSPYRLTLTETNTGKASSMKISVDGDTALQSLLNHDPGAAPAAQGFSETSTAQNAEFKIDGIAISKTSNSVSDVIQGVTLNLAKTNVGSPTNVVVARDTSTVIGAVGSFVKAYNDINQNLKDASAYNATTKTAAILNGEATVRTIQTQIRNVLTAPIEGGASAFKVLSEIGVTLQKDGSLAVDNTKLQAKLDSNFDDLAALFSAVGKPSDSLVSYASSGTKTKPGSYDVNVSQLATKGTLTASSAIAGLSRGSSTASAAPASLNIIAGVNDTLQVELDGVTANITLAQNNYADSAALAAEIQSKINAASEFSSAGLSASVSETGGVLKITSNSFGASSAASITGGNGQTNLNLDGGATVTAGTNATITGANKTLQVLLDGVTTDITLAEGSYTATMLAAEVQSKINGASAFVSAGSSVAVTQSNGVLKITSNLYGSVSAASITGGTGQADLFGTGTATAGLDTTGTINGKPAIGSGQFLTGATGDNSEGLRIKIVGGNTGARGTVNYSQGYAYQYDKLSELLLGTSGPIASRTDGINASIKSITQSKQAMTDRLAVTEKRYRAQFTALDLTISSMTKTSSFLTQQLANLPTIS